MSLKNTVTPPGIDPETVRLVAQRLNRYTTPGPIWILSRRMSKGHCEVFHKSRSLSSIVKAVN